MTETEYRTASGWLKHPDYAGVTVLDPDGWDRSRFEESWAELISRAEFNRRLVASTVQMKRTPKWVAQVELADKLDSLIDEMFTDEAKAAENEIRQLLWENKVGIIRALQSLRT